MPGPRGPRGARHQRHHHPEHPHHPGHHPGPGRPEGGFRHGRGRAPRGDVRTAVLLLLAEEPMHGYQLMQAIADRTGGRWRPSPGTIYPTINQLEDEGLITVTSESGRRLASLTDAGRAHVAEGAGTWADPFGRPAGAGGSVDLRGEVEQLRGAAREVARTGSPEQAAAAARVLGEARRALYRLLAEDPGTERG